MDYATQRKNMVESQVRPSDVTDRRIIRAMLELPRERFVPERVRGLAYMDGPVLVSTPGTSPRRAMLSARVLAKLVQSAAIEPAATVLNVGAGTGYTAALLSRLAATVVALESDPALMAVAREALADLSVGNVKLVEGALAEGQPQDGPYDAIVAEGAVEEMPRALIDQLKDGGRLVAISGAGNTGRASVWRRDGSTFGTVEVFDAAAEALPGFEKARVFAL